MRTKTIILGAIAALALVTLSANAGNRATPQAQGSVVSLVAATTTVARAHRDATATAAATAIHAEAVDAVTKPVVAARPVPKVTVSAACQDAINTLKALHQADVAEDTAERAAAQQPLTPSAIAADKAEDAAELQKWQTALLAARTACLPQPNAACQAAIAALQALRANGADDWRQWIEQWQDLRTVNWTAQLASLRTAVSAVATACGERD
ncbi:MAG: hypothetical protein E6I43_08015 [Chloroflexi bacterium]|nr:MAG: hypothetical protein E6I43_08015 [Chloroflexota bacterium]